MKEHMGVCNWNSKKNPVVSKLCAFEKLSLKEMTFSLTTDLKLWTYLHNMHVSKI